MKIPKKVAFWAVTVGSSIAVIGSSLIQSIMILFVVEP